jgi:hypothetical protein
MREDIELGRKQALSDLEAGYYSLAQAYCGMLAGKAEALRRLEEMVNL